MIKDIEGFENLYGISDEDFNIYNLKTMKPLKNQITNKGYYSVKLVKDGKKYHKLVHRIVAKAFVENDNPEIKTIVMHKDNNKLNINPDNLAWGTYSDNSKQAAADGINIPPRPDNRKHYVITNNKRNIHCQGLKEAINYIGYGNEQVGHNIVNRHSKIKEGPYKGYYIEKFENVPLYKLVNVQRTSPDGRVG